MMISGSQRGLRGFGSASVAEIYDDGNGFGFYGFIGSLGLNRPDSSTDVAISEKFAESAQYAAVP
jgi:hypothetical protein